MLWSAREGGHFSYYCSPPVWHVKGGQNQYAYSSQASTRQNQCLLFDQRLLPQATSRMFMNTFLMGDGRLCYVWSKCAVGHYCRHPPGCQKRSCQLPRRAQGAEWRGRKPKWLWQGNLRQIPWQLPPQPSLIKKCHTHKEITKWI